MVRNAASMQPLRSSYLPDRTVERPQSSSHPNASPASSVVPARSSPSIPNLLQEDDKTISAELAAAEAQVWSLKEMIKLKSAAQKQLRRQQHQPQIPRHFRETGPEAMREWENALRELEVEAGLRSREPAKEKKNAASYTKPFCDFLTENPTVFHAVDALKQDLKNAGFTQLSERDAWKIEPSGKYFVERNGSSMIAFAVGAKYEPGNGAAVLAGHVDALTAKLKPISNVPNKAGYLQLGVAPYAGGLGKTWWDRDLGIGGRVHVREGDKIVTKLAKLDWPIAKIATLAEHFGWVESFVGVCRSSTRSCRGHIRTYADYYW